jgi:hypothetical protein
LMIVKLSELFLKCFNRSESFLWSFESFCDDLLSSDREI